MKTKGLEAWPAERLASHYELCLRDPGAATAATESPATDREHSHWRRQAIRCARLGENRAMRPIPALVSRSTVGTLPNGQYFSGTNSHPCKVT